MSPSSWASYIQQLSDEGENNTSETMRCHFCSPASLKLRLGLERPPRNAPLPALAPFPVLLLLILTAPFGSHSLNKSPVFKSLAQGLLKGEPDLSYHYHINWEETPPHHPLCLQESKRSDVSFF